MCDNDFSHGVLSSQTEEGPTPELMAAGLVLTPDVVDSLQHVQNLATLCPRFQPQSPILGQQKNPFNFLLCVQV